MPRIPSRPTTGRLPGGKMTASGAKTRKTAVVSSRSHPPTNVESNPAIAARSASVSVADGRAPQPASSDATISLLDRLTPMPCSDQRPTGSILDRRDDRLSADCRARRDAQDQPIGHGMEPPTCRDRWVEPGDTNGSQWSTALVCPLHDG
jgi:hypothetical protein